MDGRRVIIFAGHSRLDRIKGPKVCRCHHSIYPFGFSRIVDTLPGKDLIDEMALVDYDREMVKVKVCEWTGDKQIIL